MFNRDSSKPIVRVLSKISKSVGQCLKKTKREDSACTRASDHSQGLVASVSVLILSSFSPLGPSRYVETLSLPKSMEHVTSDNLKEATTISTPPLTPKAVTWDEVNTIPFPLMATLPSIELPHEFLSLPSPPPDVQATRPATASISGLVCATSWHVAGTAAFKALSAECLSDSDFKQGLEAIRPGLVLAPEPELSPEVRAYALQLLEIDYFVPAKLIRARIVQRMAQEQVIIQHASLLDLSDVWWRNLMELGKPGFVLPRDTEISRNVRAYAVNLLIRRPYITAQELTERTCREIRMETRHNALVNERLAMEVEKESLQA